MRCRGLWSGTAEGIVEVVRGLGSLKLTNMQLWRSHSCTVASRIFRTNFIHQQVKSNSTSHLVLPRGACTELLPVSSGWAFKANSSNLLVSPMSHTVQVRYMPH